MIVSNNILVTVKSVQCWRCVDVATGTFKTASVPEPVPLPLPVAVIVIMKVTVAWTLAVYVIVIVLAVVYCNPHGHYDKYCFLDG